MTNAYDAYQQEAGYNQTALNNYDTEIGGNVGGQTTGNTQNTLAPNYVGGTLGGAAAGAGLYNQYFGGGSNSSGNSGSYFETPFAYPSGGFFGG